MSHQRILNLLNSASGIGGGFSSSSLPDRVGREKALASVDFAGVVGSDDEAGGAGGGGPMSGRSVIVELEYSGKMLLNFG